VDVDVLVIVKLTPGVDVNGSVITIGVAERMIGVEEGIEVLMGRGWILHASQALSNIMDITKRMEDFFI
jgi:hypothetical protein